jgi:hypothetical protein
MANADIEVENQLDRSRSLDLPNVAVMQVRMISVNTWTTTESVRLLPRLIL